MKVCTRCQIEKPVASFYRQSQRGKNGKIWQYRDSFCIQCRSEYTTLRRIETKRKAVAYLGGECKDCGLIDIPQLYDFHHLDPSQKDFSIGKQNKRFESIKAELSKCILLCSNCHRRRHALHI